MEVAQWWRKGKDDQIRCYLCPHRCKIEHGKAGICNVRVNRAGELFSLVYGQPAALNIDPIEKKPLYHFQPGSRALSVGTVGCNLACKFCQNWQLVQGSPETGPDYPPQQIVEMALEHNCQSIAFTYNEPTIFGEYVLDISKLAQQKDLKTIMVTNGFITEEAIKDIYPHIDAANIDLKFFTNKLYKKYTGGRLTPILKAIKKIKSQNTFIEITNLIIPKLNDSIENFKASVQWIKDNLGSETPFHLSAFHPSHKMKDRERTSKNTLDKLYKIARKAGIQHVYEGNVMSDEHNNTYCPACGRLLIERNYFSVTQNNIENGRCKCGKEINLVT